MDLKELRVGNYYDFGNPELEPKGIQKLNRYSLGVKLTIHNIDIHPVPLTEEWLLKFGFEAGREGDLDLFPLKYYREPLRYNGKEANIFVSDFGDDSHYDLPCKHIKYVHQLQNLFYVLVGEELTIK